MYKLLDPNLRHIGTSWFLVPSYLMYFTDEYLMHKY